MEQGIERVHPHLTCYFGHVHAVDFGSALHGHDADVFPRTKLCNAVPAVRFHHFGHYGIPQCLVCLCLFQHGGQVLGSKAQIIGRKQAEQACASVFIGILVIGDVKAFVPHAVDLFKNLRHLCLILAPYCLEVRDFKPHPGLTDIGQDFIYRRKDVVAFASVVDGKDRIMLLHNGKECQDFVFLRIHARGIIQTA